MRKCGGIVDNTHRKAGEEIDVVVLRHHYGWIVSLLRFRSW